LTFNRVKINIEGPGICGYKIVVRKWTMKTHSTLAAHTRDSVWTFYTGSVWKCICMVTTEPSTYMCYFTHQGTLHHLQV